MSHFFKSSRPIDPFKKLTESMHRFNIGMQDWYISNDGFRHNLKHPRYPGIQSNQMTTKCIACGANRTDDYSEIQTRENELIAVEVAHWQMNHREKCKVPLANAQKEN